MRKKKKKARERGKKGSRVPKGKMGSQAKEIRGWALMGWPGRPRPGSGAMAAYH